MAICFSSKIYGCYESSTQTWIDGLLVKLLQQFALWKEVQRAQAFDHGQDLICRNMQQWLVLDGTVSVSWVSQVEGLLDAYSLAVMENQKRLQTTSEEKLKLFLSVLSNAIFYTFYIFTLFQYCF